MIHFDFLVPTDGNLSVLGNLLSSLAQQTLLPDRIVFLLHKKITVDDLHTFQYMLEKHL